MKLTSKPLAAIVIALMFGGIMFSSAMGWWNTESNKQVRKLTQGPNAGSGDPADIRGSYTFGDVETNFGIPAELLAQAFGVVTDDAAAFPVKSLETLYAGSPLEVGTASVRLFTAFYLDLPIDLSTEMYLPESAAAILRTRPLSTERLSYLEAHTVPNLEGVTAPAPVEEHDSAIDTTIKGKTTFADLLDWGVAEETIATVLGAPLPAARGMTVKDFCLEQGLEFGMIKAALQAEVDAVK
jgi:hypothetical protein